MARVELDWKSLLHQTEDLARQDFHNFPRIERNVEQLQQRAESLRARTNQSRSLNNQIAATRLLAQQGFDATRLAQDVINLEIQPSIQDVFQTEATTIEEHLQRLEEATILTAIQEAQLDTAAGFEAHIEECIAKEWDGNRRQLYGLISPNMTATSSALGPVATNVPLIGGTPSRAAASTPLIGTPGAGASAPAIAAGVSTATPRERAYIEVVRRLVTSQAAGTAFDSAKEFGAACKANEERSGSETTMAACWGLLGDIVGEARSRNASSSTPVKFADALAQGARRHLERGYAAHMRTTISRHPGAAVRGADPDQLREVQAFLAVKFSTRGPFDFQQPGGFDSSWIQLYCCLRNGWHEAARRVAERVQDGTAARVSEGGFRGVLEEWIRGGGHLPDRMAAQLMRECERLLQDKASIKSQLGYTYMLHVVALLAGDVRAVDALTQLLSINHQPAVLATIEDYMWARLMMVNTQPAPSAPTFSGSGSYSHYGLTELAADINRWPPAYYSKQGKEPLLALTVLLLSLQFAAAVRYIWRDESTRAYRVDAVHLAIAAHVEGVLTVGAGDQSPDVSSMLHAFGRKYVHGDSAVALMYYMLAASTRGSGVAVRGALLRELLSESRDYGTLLGGGGAAGAGGALALYVPDVKEREALLEAVAYECQVAAQSDEAVELYLAANRPAAALALLNMQLSGAIPRAVEEAAGGLGLTSASDAAQQLATRARDAKNQTSVSTDPAARREAEVYDQLMLIWKLCHEVRAERPESAMRGICELPFIPLERSRVEACARAAQALHPALLDRLSDILGAAADAIWLLRHNAGPERVSILRAQLDAIMAFATAISHRVGRGVYQKLCDCAAALS